MIPVIASDKDSPIYYDDPTYDYREFWKNRSYEHFSEVLAITKLLSGKHFKYGIDLGGGYGRLTSLLKDYCDKIALIEPSTQQLDFAKDYLKDLEVEYLDQHAHNLKLSDNSVGVAIMIRVSHHLKNPTPEFKEIFRVLEPAGLAIIEIANYSHFRNRLKYAVKGKSMPIDPVPIGQIANSVDEPTPFYNHNPKTIAKELKTVGFEIVTKLSVSNLRSRALKKIASDALLLKVEKISQSPLAKLNFGPSIFFLVTKK